MGAQRVFVIGSPVAVGHVRPLMPLARRLVERGYAVLWAISGDDNEPASAWRAPLAELGVELIDVDAVAKFARGTTAEFASTSMTSVLRRTWGRANDVAEGAAAAILAAAAGRPIAAGVYDFFGVFAYLAMKRLGIAQVDVVISAYPTVLEETVPADDPVYQRELGRARASGIGELAGDLSFGLIPRDPALRVLCFTSPRLCPTPPAGVTLLGLQREVLPRDAGATPPEHQALVNRLAGARAAGRRVVLLSMGTVVIKILTRMGGERAAFLRTLYSTLAATALDAGALVVASTTESSAEALGLDDRAIAMPFVPQPLLFARGFVDVMLMHGGANTFHEAASSGVPLVICPVFGDQPYVAQAATALGLGASIESPTIASLPGAQPLARIAADIFPAMLAPGTTRWRATALALREQLREEDGVANALALVDPREG